MRSHGTEGRCTAEGRPGDEVDGTENVFDYIVFRAADVLDLKIDDPSPKKEQAPPTPAAQPAKQEPSMPQVSVCPGQAAVMKPYGCKRLRSRFRERF